MEKIKSLFWGSTQISDTSWYYVNSGTLELWLKKNENGELMVGNRRNGTRAESPLKWTELSSKDAAVDTDSSIKWDWYAGHPDREITVLPAMPDRPLVLKPQINRHILPGSKTQVLFFIPVWLQIYSGSEAIENLITQHPSEILSSTWFGEMQSGELCYALKRDLQESRPSVSISPLSAVCTLNIHNDSQALLDFQRMAVHVEYLSIFTDGHSLYTNEVSVKFNGVDQISQVKYSARAPKWSGSTSRIKGPREKPTKSLLRKSFYFIKSLTEM